MISVVWVGEQMWHAPVPPEGQEFLEEVLDAGLAPLSAEAYQQGPAAILFTEARFAYVLHGDRVLWLVEWPPGLLVVAFSPDGGMAHARVPLPAIKPGAPEEPVGVRLVTEPWAAALDPREREYLGYAPAPAPVRARWEAATAGVQALGEELWATLGDDPARFEAWRATCERSEFWQEADRDHKPSG